MALDRVVTAASRNLLSTTTSDRSASPIGVMVVADPEGVKGFERLRGLGSVVNSTGKWSTILADHQSATLSNESGMQIVALRGQQLITREGLEVLAMGHGRDLKSGLTLAKMVDAIRGLGGLAIVAWGVGKWLGKRGRLVNDLVVTEGGCPDIMLCDNAGRPRVWSQVPQFDLAEEHSMRIVAGSDPLPLRGEESRVGGYGICLPIEFREGQSVAEAFRRAVIFGSRDLEFFGDQIRFGKFISSQFRLRISRTDCSS